MVLRLLLLCFSLVACHAQERPPAFTEDATLGGVTVAASALNQGHGFYQLHCAACHGANGSGTGPVGIQQIPAPRDLRLGILKYASVPAGELPTDDDLHHLIATGLRGTGMQPWRFRDEEITAVTQYIKTLSPRWRQEKTGTPIARHPDPFGGPTPQAIQQGRALYHDRVANCMSCHPRYDGSVTGVRADPEHSLAVDTMFGKIVAPDLRAAPRRTGDTPSDVYQIIAAGVGGTGMVPMEGKLTGDALWALTYYVLSLKP